MYLTLLSWLLEALVTRQGCDVAWRPGIDVTVSAGGQPRPQQQWPTRASLANAIFERIEASGHLGR